MLHKVDLQRLNKQTLMKEKFYLRTGNFLITAQIDSQILFSSFKTNIFYTSHRIIRIRKGIYYPLIKIVAFLSISIIVHTRLETNYWRIVNWKETKKHIFSFNQSTILFKCLFTRLNPRKEQTKKAVKKKENATFQSNFSKQMFQRYYGQKWIRIKL